MLGNDVVDLGDAETRDGPSHPRFDARVFAPSERTQLAASADPNRLRWSLWAAKEATYKLGVKREPGLVFSPSCFIVALNGALEGSVRYPGGTADVAVRHEGDAIHAVATEATSGNVVSDVVHGSDTADASQSVRGLALERVAKRLGVAPAALRIGSRGRVPTLTLRDDAQFAPHAAPIALDLSLSHHGRYLAFACELGASPR